MLSRWRRLRQSFWFLPAGLCALAVVLAEALVFLDRRLHDVDLGPFGVLATEVGEAGSRDLLGAIAGSMLTVASTTFSITVAALALASSTYGPRLVRNFMADRGNQLVLGVFVATFLYSLLVLRSIRTLGDRDEGQAAAFVPHLAVNVAVLLAVLAIGMLVYFIHHISDSIQVWTLSRQVRTDLITVIQRRYPEQLAADGRDIEDADAVQEVVARVAVDGVRVRSEQIGYLQGIDHAELVGLAVAQQLVVSLPVRPGSHVVTGDTLAMLWPPDRVDDDTAKRLRKTVLIGQDRTPQQDVEFAVLLLEEMAVRALSPGTNDPYTAVNALDDLSAGLVLLANRPSPSPYRYDPQGHLRVITAEVTLTELLDHVLDAMRLYAIEHLTVLLRTLELVEQVGAASRQPAVRARLDTQVQRLVEAYALSSPQSCDAAELGRHAQRVRRSLARPVGRGDLQGRQPDDLDGR